MQADEGTQSPTRLSKESHSDEAQQVSRWVEWVHDSLISTPPFSNRTEIWPHFGLETTRRELMEHKSTDIRREARQQSDIVNSCRGCFVGR